MSEALLWTLITVVGAVGTALFSYATYRVCRAIGKGFVPPQLAFGEKPAEKICPVKYAKLRLALFFLLTMLWLVLLAVSHNAARWRWMLYVMMSLATAAWLSAMAENALLPARASAAALCGKLKWALLILWVAGMFVGLMGTGFSYF